MKTIRENTPQDLSIVKRQIIKWTKEMVLDLAKNYSFMNHFKTNEPKAYQAARGNKWLDDVRQLMQPKYQYWAVEDVLKEAEKYVYLKDFREKSPKAYGAAVHRNLIPKIKEFLKITPSSVPSLSPEDVTRESQKYLTKKDFRTKSPLAYTKALDYDLFGKTITHLGDKLDRKPPNYWTYEKVRLESEKYNSRKEFQDKSPQAQAAAKQHGWYHDLVKDMPILGSLKERGVYAWEFPDKSVYVGLTYDFRRREIEHTDPEGSTAVSKKIKQIGQNPTFVKKSDYINSGDASILEGSIIETYRNEGWDILNKAKAGGLGGCKRFWTFEKVQEEAIKYNTKDDFKRGSSSAYTIAVREKWINKICKHMEQKYINWTPEMVYQISSKYDNLTLFLKQQPKAAGAARRLKIFDDVVKNMSRSLYDTTQKRKNCE